MYIVIVFENILRRMPAKNSYKKIKLLYNLLKKNSKLLYCLYYNWQQFYLSKIFLTPNLYPIYNFEYILDNTDFEEIYHLFPRSLSLFYANSNSANSLDMIDPFILLVYQFKLHSHCFVIPKILETAICSLRYS